MIKLLTDLLRAFVVWVAILWSVGVLLVAAVWQDLAGVPPALVWAGAVALVVLGLLVLGSAAAVLRIVDLLEESNQIARDVTAVGAGPARGARQPPPVGAAPRGRADLEPWRTR